MGRGVTISKKIQKGSTRGLKKGRVFYRVKNPAGKTIQDFKTKVQAKRLQAKLKGKF